MVSLCLPHSEGYWRVGVLGENKVVRLASVLILFFSLAVILATRQGEPPSEGASTEDLLRLADQLLAGEEISFDKEGIFGGDAFNVITEREREEAKSYPPVVFREYVVRKGDNIWKIAKKFGLDWYTVLSVNRLKNANYLRPGQKLRIPNQRGVLHVVKRGETLEDIALKYDVKISHIVGANRITDPDQIKAGTELFIPNAKLTYKKRQEIVRRSNIPPTFIMPCRGRISSRFGWRLHPIYHRRMFHSGIDIVAPRGTLVYAARSGRVKFAGWLGGYGRLVVIDHGNGYETRYAHLSSILVRKGQRVRTGQPIGRVGNTGVTTGVHLHFEVRRGGKPVNPLSFLRFR
ncbi:hypothetical protein DRP77_10165 [Candidatus Poribacteria bacterium]|nr:MAG: hypothetical protein DRP77_10165 [Candidatus Poribacteria bacterium]